MKCGIFGWHTYRSLDSLHMEEFSSNLFRLKRNELREKLKKNSKGKEWETNTRGKKEINLPNEQFFPV